jgi:hypothetical protein
VKVAEMIAAIDAMNGEFMRVMSGDNWYYDGVTLEQHKAEQARWQRDDEVRGVPKESKVEDKPARDEAECPTCHRNNDRGVDKCWNCQHKDPYPLASVMAAQDDDWSSSLMRVAVPGPSGGSVGYMSFGPGIAPPTQQPQPAGPTPGAIGYYNFGHFAPAPPVATQPFSLTLTNSMEAAMLAKSYLADAADDLRNGPDASDIADALFGARRAVEILEGIK